MNKTTKEQLYYQVNSMLDKLYVELDAISSKLPNLKVELDKMNAPLIIGANN